ncbi:TIGR03667 family PPOX class F420-dependent oxidoreductase [Streptomyces aidingensis]|uniref:PPOX class probable F420-dependent enzyme, Rv3369 family n=1 Tax=Streptomyces aidingensis TaxID=910347 RepID=A0A1I1J8L7_9ACTN|nr:TIGR03667 family PPOX class F420-dependent oxidoreductase [Streptomyces aidingensis]SFC44461.1 PPOX class probable F420-dependent enzyme, Rv3369 family [Streptomyces aidingensis]
MSDTVLPGPDTSFGRRVRERLAAERVVWFTTVGADGTPQPNPVWFLWEDGGFLVYNRTDAGRLANIAARPQVSLHFNSDREGQDIVVFRGRARRAGSAPPPHEHPAYTDKYGQAMSAVTGSREKFGEAFAVPLRIDVTRVRGY